MNSIRRTSVIATGILVLGAAPLAFAGVTGKVIEQLRDRNGGDDEQSQSQPAPREQQPEPRTRQAAPRGDRAAATPRAPESRPNVGSGQARLAPSLEAQLRNRGQAPRNAANAQPNDNQPRGNTPRANDSPARGVIGDMLTRNRNGNGGNNHGNHQPRPPHVVQQLPRGYHNYNWNGRPYYSYGGRWYRPYGSSYISIGVPYGLFVSTLPGYSTSFYYGNNRYYYYDDTYYTYEPLRRGYVVARSPYGDDEEEGYYYDEDAVDQDLFVYPAKGQSEQQQADDRYDCHSWGVKETGYDPIDDEYDRGKRADYLRAMTACLTGRGYTVR